MKSGTLRSENRPSNWKVMMPTPKHYARTGCGKAVEAPIVGMDEPGPGHEAGEQPSPLAHKSTRVRTAKNRYIPSYTGKSYGYAMTQIMESMHGKSAIKSVQHMTKELRSVGEHRRPDIVGMVMVQLSMKAATAKFVEARTMKVCQANPHAQHVCAKALAGLNRQAERADA